MSAVCSRSLAVVLPVLVRSPADIANLQAVVSALRAGTTAAIWVVEQNPEQAPTFELPFAVQRVGMTSKRSVIERSRLTNLIATRIQADRLWLHEPSLLLPFAEIAGRLGQSEAVFVQPYARCRRLRREETERYDARETAWQDAVPSVPVPLGKGSFVVRRDVFLALGGLSEAFVGRADEGLELVRRLKPWFSDFEQYPYEGVELWTGSAPDDGAGRQANKALHSRLVAAIDDDAAGYVARRLETSLPTDVPSIERLAQGAARARAFRFSSPAVPPRRPQRLPGTMWGITSLFNPAGYRSKRNNFATFRARLADDGLPLLAVELAFGERGFELDETSADRVVQLRDGDVLWQKERLLNVAVASLPPECDKVVWLDADILFERTDWVSKTAEELEQYVVVQPFSRSTRLLENEVAISIDELPVGSGEHEVLHSMAYGVAAKGYGCLGRYLEHGHCGYAWATRRALLSQHGLYDANVLGNGDLNTAHAMFGGAKYLRTERLSAAARRHLERWAAAFHRDVQGSVTYLDGTVFHLWHGQKSDRRYVDRLHVLVEHEYDPERDLVHSGGGYRWASEKHALQRVCLDYFAERREDG